MVLKEQFPIKHTPVTSIRKGMRLLVHYDNPKQILVDRVRRDKDNVTFVYLSHPLPCGRDYVRYPTNGNCVQVRGSHELCTSEGEFRGDFIVMRNYRTNKTRRLHKICLNVQWGVCNYQ